MDEAHAFEEAVLRTIRMHVAVVPDDRVLIATSGGADSTALLAVLAALVRARALRVTLAVAHLNHRMRGPASDRDATFVQGLAWRLGLPCFVGDAAALAGVRSNREAAARAARHAFLARQAEEWGATRIALAHTRDDQAETLLLRLARGAGPASLAAMRVARDDGVIRPLLEQPRAACVAYLQACGLAWVEDETNADERYFRNRLRRRLLPLLDAELGVDVRARLARIAGQLREESTLAEQRIDELLCGRASRTELPLDVVREAAQGSPRLIHAWLARAGIRANARQTATLARIASGEDPSATVVLGYGMQVRRVYEALRLLPSGREGAPGRPQGYATLDVPGRAAIPGWRVTADAAAAPRPAPSAGDGAARAWVDLDELPGALWLRPPAPGDRVRLAHGRRKLADILIDAKVPRHERAQLAVIGGGTDLLWVPGVVRSVVAGVSPTTRRCVIVRAERLENDGRTSSPPGQTRAS